MEKKKENKYFYISIISLLIFLGITLFVIFQQNCLTKEYIYQKFEEVKQSKNSIILDSLSNQRLIKLEMKQESWSNNISIVSIFFSAFITLFAGVLAFGIYFNNKENVKKLEYKLDDFNEFIKGNKKEINELTSKFLESNMEIYNALGVYYSDKFISLIKDVNYDILDALLLLSNSILYQLECFSSDKINADSIKNKMYNQINDYINKFNELLKVFENKNNKDVNLDTRFKYMIFNLEKSYNLSIKLNKDCSKLLEKIKNTLIKNNSKNN